jgi:hypothetical protein
MNAQAFLTLGQSIPIVLRIMVIDWGTRVQWWSIDQEHAIEEEEMKNLSYRKNRRSNTARKTRQDKTRQDKTRQDKTRQDKTRQERNCNNNEGAMKRAKHKHLTLTGSILMSVAIIASVCEAIRWYGIEICEAHEPLSYWAGIARVSGIYGNW